MNRLTSIDHDSLEHSKYSTSEIQTYQTGISLV